MTGRDFLILPAISIIAIPKTKTMSVSKVILLIVKTSVIKAKIANPRNNKKSRLFSLNLIKNKGITAVNKIEGNNEKYSMVTSWTVKPKSIYAIEPIGNTDGLPS